MDEAISLLLGPAGATFVLLFIIFSGWKGWWVFGRQHAEEKKEKEMWREIALRGTAIAETVAKLKANGPS